MVRDKWSEKRVQTEISKRYVEGQTLRASDINKGNTKLYNAARRYFGNWRNAIESCGINYKEVSSFTKGDISKEDLIASIKRLYADGINIRSEFIKINYGNLFGQAQKYFGSWGDAVVLAGIDYSDFKRTRICYSKEQIISKINKRKASNKSLSTLSVRKEDPRLYNSAIKIFGDWKTAIESSGIDYFENVAKTKVDYWNKAKIISKIRKYHESGVNMCVTNIMRIESSLTKQAEMKFGSWENALIASKIPLAEEVKQSHLQVSYLGFQFEKIVKETLLHLGFSFKRRYNEKIRPDFVLPNGHFIDAKLSEWTVFNSNTIQKYEPFCEKMSIVFLRGDRTKNSPISDKTTLTSIFVLINKIKDDNTRRKLRTDCDDLLIKINKDAS
jgi:hypothetical protein